MNASCNDIELYCPLFTTQRKLHHYKGDELSLFTIYAQNSCHDIDFNKYQAIIINDVMYCGPNYTEKCVITNHESG